MKNLIKDKYYKEEYTYKKLFEMKYSWSTFIINLGLRKKYPQLAVHNIYLGENYKKGIEVTFQGTLPENPSLYICWHSRIDRSMVKGGGLCLSLIH